MNTALPSLRLPRASLKQKSVERIRAAIQNGEFHPGQQVTENGLARSLGVAQTTVREALIELENQGFIERLSPRNTRITCLTARKVDEIYAVRLALEILAVDIVTSMPDVDLEGCREANRELRRAAAEAAMNRFFAADLQFHRELWRATKNSCLADALERIVPKLFAFGVIRHYRVEPPWLEEVAVTHDHLIALIASGEKTAASRWMNESLRRAWVDDVQLAESQQVAQRQLTAALP